MPESFNHGEAMENNNSKGEKYENNPFGEQFRLESLHTSKSRVNKLKNEILGGNGETVSKNHSKDMESTDPKVNGNETTDDFMNLLKEKGLDDFESQEYKILLNIPFENRTPGQKLRFQELLDKTGFLQENEVLEVG